MGAALCLGQVAPLKRRGVSDTKSPFCRPRDHRRAVGGSRQAAVSSSQRNEGDPIFNAQDEPALASIVLTAAKQGHTGILSIIIEHVSRTAGLEASGATSITTLGPAVSKGHVCPASGHAADVPPAAAGVLPPAAAAAAAAAHDAVQERLRCILDARTPLMQTPLMVAAFYAKDDVVRLLLAAGADPWVTSQPYCRSALHYAALSGSAKCLEALLQDMSPSSASRYIDLRTASGFTAVGYAVASRSLEAVQVLLTWRPDVTLASTVRGGDAPDFCPVGSTPLHLAAIVGHRGIATEILRYHVESANASPIVDVRLRQDASRRRPTDVARSTGHESLSHLLHPAFDLSALLSTGAVRYIGVSQLKCLAAAALKTSLLASCAHAESLAPSHMRGVCDGAPPSGLEDCAHRTEARNPESAHGDLKAYSSSQLSGAYAKLSGRSTHSNSSSSGGRTTHTGHISSGRPSLEMLLLEARGGCAGGATRALRCAVPAWLSAKLELQKQSLARCSSSSSSASNSAHGQWAVGSLEVPAAQQQQQLSEASGSNSGGGNGGDSLYGCCAGDSVMGFAAEALALCGVCYDRPESLCAIGCRHRLCATCAAELARQIQRKPALCPFCRAPFSGFGPITPGGAAAAAAGSGAWLL